MKIIETPEAPAAVGPYSQSVAAHGFLFLSGQIALDPATGEIVGETIEEQARRVMRNIEAVLKAAGTDFSRVVKTTCFLKHMSDFAPFNAVYEEFFVSRPARSCVAAAQLPRDVLVEVEVIALLPSACKNGCCCSKDSEDSK
ncbi:MAG: RidA family protein, partial [Planctomycetia bacterium]|nr:RidA family protein [Planctomycetia bacterium]